MEAVLTKHAELRIKERCGLGKHGGKRLTEIAYENGISLEEATGQLKRYIQHVIDKSYIYLNNNEKTIKIYAEKVWIYDDYVLITVIPIPKDLRTQANIQIKRKR